MVIFWFFFIDNWFYCKYIPHLSQIYLADSAWVSFRDYPFDCGFKSKHWEFQIALFYLVLNPIFLDLDGTLIQDVTSAFTTVSLVLGTCMEQFMYGAMHWVFDLLFYRGYLCDLQKRILSPNCPNTSFLLFRCTCIIIDINTYNVISWEKDMTFFTIDLRLVKAKPVKKKFGKLFDFFYYYIFCFINTIRCVVLSVQLATVTPSKKYNNSHEKILKINGPKTEFWGIPQKISFHELYALPIFSTLSVWDIQYTSANSNAQGTKIFVRINECLN